MVADRASIPAFATAACPCNGMPVKWKAAETKIIRPPVEGLVPVFGFFFADMRSCGMVALKVLKEPMVSMSRTVLKALAERPERGAMKFPAAPAL